MFRRRPSGHVPVFAGPRCIELADPARVRRLLNAPNIEVIRRRKDRAICEIHLLEFGDDLRLPSRQGNPLVLSHRTETDENPRQVWTLKPLKNASTPDAE